MNRLKATHLPKGDIWEGRGVAHGPGQLVYNLQFTYYAHYALYYIMHITKRSSLGEENKHCQRHNLKLRRNFRISTKIQLHNLYKLLPTRSSASTSATVRTSTSFELASSHVRVTSIKFTKQEGRSPQNGTVISGGCQIKVTSFWWLFWSFWDD